MFYFIVEETEPSLKWGQSSQDWIGVGAASSGTSVDQEDSAPTLNDFSNSCVRHFISSPTFPRGSGIPTLFLVLLPELGRNRPEEGLLRAIRGVIKTIVQRGVG